METRKRQRDEQKEKDYLELARKRVFNVAKNSTATEALHQVPDLPAHFPLPVLAEPAATSPVVISHVDTDTRPLPVYRAWDPMYCEKDDRVNADQAHSAPLNGTVVALEWSNREDSYLCRVKSAHGGRSVLSVQEIRSECTV